MCCWAGARLRRSIRCRPARGGAATRTPLRAASGCGRKKWSRTTTSRPTCGAWCGERGGLMRYLALATDYDGTIAHDGVVDDATLDALRRLRESGRRVLLVTGRELDELLGVF